MSESKIIEAAKSGDNEELARLLKEGADVHERGEQEWTPLNFAAGRGDVEAVRLLLEHGADVTVTGRDNRTPLQIAKAAGRKEVAEILTEAEKEKGVWQDPRLTVQYCKAYYLKDLRGFPGWSESRINWKEEDAGQNGDASPDAPLADEDVVYVHQDFTVTRSAQLGESVVFNQVTPEWREFCEKKLEFAIPEEYL